MKKIILIMLTGLLGFSLFACTDKTPQNQPPDSKPALSMYDTIIQDDSGVDKCFWENGLVSFNDNGGTGRQRQKSASLTMQTEYDMWLRMRLDDLDLANDYYPVEFEYDETKIEIKENSEKENHFIIKAVQPCDKEEVIIKLTAKHALDDKLDENGEPYGIPITQNITILISSEA